MLHSNVIIYFFKNSNLDYPIGQAFVKALDSSLLDLDGGDLWLVLNVLILHIQGNLCPIHDDVDGALVEVVVDQIL